MNNPKNFKDGEQILEQIEMTALSEWLAEHYTEFGVDVIFITNKSPEGF